MWDYLFDPNPNNSPPRTWDTMWDYLFDPNPNNSPLKQRVSLQANYLHTGRSNAPIEIQLFTAWEGGTPYVKYLQSWSLLYEHHGHSSTSTTAKFSREPNSFTGGLLRAFCASGVGRPIAPLRHWGIYTSSNITHTHD